MKMGLKYSVRVWGYYALLLILGVLFLGNLSTDWVALALNAALIVAGMLMAYNEGAYSGEKACTLTASLEKQIKEGRNIDASLRAQVYNKKIAAWILIVGSAPFLLISTINAIAAPFYPEITSEPAVEESAEQTAGSFEFDYSDEEEEAAPVNWANVIARVAFMPFVSVYTLVRGNVLNALFFPFSVLMPSACAVGYYMGPKLRDKKLHDIAKGKKRKMKNLKVNKKPRQQKAEV